jgi:hypothetical protein
MDLDINFKNINANFFAKNADLENLLEILLDFNLKINIIN